jgi:hypothetical protein
MTITRRTASARAALAGSVAISALLSAAFLVGPQNSARADTSAATTTQPQPAQHHTAAAQAGDMQPETVEQRITTLHIQLKITPDEDAKWNDVAQAMRENASALEKLSADRASQGSQGMTAIDDLMSYEKFAQAHVDGLKNLISSFETLYAAMPDPQKKIADEVFQSNPTKGRTAHS